MSLNFYSNDLFERKDKSLIEISFEQNEAKAFGIRC